MFYFFVLLGWGSVVTANDCLLDINNLPSNFFYLSPTHLDLPCVNEWELSRTTNISYKLVVSPIQQDNPLLKQLYHQNNTAQSESYEVNWLININKKCLENEIRSGAPVADFSKINNQFLLMSFSSIHLSLETADNAVLSCHKVDISFRHSWIKEEAHTFSISNLNIPVRDPSKDAFVGSLDEPEGEYMKLLEQLSGAQPMTLADGSKFTIDTRYTYNSQNAIAADWISYHMLTQADLDDVYKQEFLMPNGTPTVNVIGVKIGKTIPDEIVVVGAHFDSTSQSPNTKAPGAIDNGSGTVSVMLIASALRNMDLDRTVHLIAFGGEEQGLYGSSHYVDEAKKQGLKITAALAMDMTAYSSKYFGVTIEGTRDSSIQALMKIMSNNLAEYAEDLQVGTSTNSWGSDHVPFQKAGYAAFLAIEMDDTDYPAYHRTNDVSTYANEKQAMGILKGLAGTLYDVAQG